MLFYKAIFISIRAKCKNLFQVSFIKHFDFFDFNAYSFITAVYSSAFLRLLELFSLILSSAGMMSLMHHMLQARALIFCDGIQSPLNCEQATAT